MIVDEGGLSQQALAAVDPDGASGHVRARSETRKRISSATSSLRPRLPVGDRHLPLRPFDGNCRSASWRSLVFSLMFVSISPGQNGVDPDVCCELQRQLLNDSRPAPPSWQCRPWAPVS